ncbi:transmembrane protein 214 [Elysia marginata]|uniref:Transmembrane protein 214 n=1 Tax=Elysia marginata TaxID=1093978 RepID=A0AAV4G2A6_9GAST|nr:transmembrane protein 214 [Elysia marginata]
MASASQWEVVGKPKKGKNSPSSKSQKKQSGAKMITIEPNAPVKEDKTIYTAFLEKEEKEQLKAARGNAASARNTNGSVSSANKKPAAPKKKKVEQDGKRPEKVSISTAIAQIDHQELEKNLSESQLKFPDNPDVWLKDLASFLNLKLENVKETDDFYKGKPQGFPLALMPQSSQKVLNSVVKKFSNQMLDNLFYHCVQQMLTEAAKDQCSLGYKMFLQLLAYHKPDITMSKMHQYLELLKTHQNRPALCISILWAVGQCGTKNFKCGFKVWLELMLPMLEVRQVAHYPVEYLEQLVRAHKTVTSADGVVALREYFQVLDVVFSPGFNLSNDLRKRLNDLYPRIKELAYGDNPAQTLRTFFASYLARYNVNANPAIKNELLSCLVKCLTTDKQSFSVWCQLYMKHLVASGYLLEHICNEWSDLASLFDKKLLHETLRSFSVTNEEMETQGRGQREGLAHCQAATKDLVGRLTRASFPWGLLVFFLVSVVASIVMYDILSSPNLRKSKSMSFLEHYGVLAVLEQAWGRISTFFNLAASWLRTNCPVYFAYVRDTVGPFLVLVWTSLKEFVVTSEEVTRPHRAWMLEKVVACYHWVYELSPETWVWCHDAAVLAWEATLDYSIWLWKHAVHLAHEAEHWLTENVFTGSMSSDSIKSTAEWTVRQFQNYTSQAWANILTMVK